MSDLFEREHLEREEVLEFYKNGLKQLEAARFQARANRLMLPNEPKHADEERKLARQLAVLRDDRDQWLEANPEEATDGA